MIVRPALVGGGEPLITWADGVAILTQSGGVTLDQWRVKSIHDGDESDEIRAFCHFANPISTEFIGFGHPVTFDITSEIDITWINYPVCELITEPFALADLNWANQDDLTYSSSSGLYYHVQDFDARVIWTHTNLGFEFSVVKRGVYGARFKSAVNDEKLDINMPSLNGRDIVSIREVPFGLYYPS